jgi:hypothetical protein
VTGGVLRWVLRGLVPADRHDEFLGDLLEEAAGRRWWAWGQAVRSAPALLAMRWSRLGMELVPAGPCMAPSRSWPVPVAISLGAHALLVGALVTLVLPRVDEVQPPRAAVTLPYPAAAVAAEWPVDVTRSSRAATMGHAPAGCLSALQPAGHPCRRPTSRH